jgi:hypothetical protein
MVDAVAAARQMWEDSRRWCRQFYLASLGGNDPARRQEEYPQAVEGARQLAGCIEELHRGLCLLATVEQSEHGASLVTALAEDDRPRAEYHAMRCLAEVSSDE